MSTEKLPIDLRVTVQALLDRLAFVKMLQLKDVSEDECADLGEGTSADYSQGISLNGSVGIFLDYWGWARPHKRYSFAVFERLDGSWQQVQARIERVEDVVSRAIYVLAEQALAPPNETPL